MLFNAWMTTALNIGMEAKVCWHGCSMTLKDEAISAGALKMRFLLVLLVLLVN